MSSNRNVHTALFVFSMIALLFFASLGCTRLEGKVSVGTAEQRWRSRKSFHEDMIYPSDAGIANVKDYGAKGDGVTDDTAAIQRALNENIGGTTYLPEGTYLVSGRIEWPEKSHYPSMVLQGRNTFKTIIRLKDNCDGYQNPRSPRAVVWTRKMGSADNFRNYVKNLTIDTGQGNPGAVGLQFMSNNNGSVADVIIRSGDGSGPVGLDLAYNNMNGPLLVKSVYIAGFDIGITAKGAVNSLTFEHVFLKGQNKCGLLNNGQPISFRGLVSQNKQSIPVIRNLGDSSFMTLIDSTLIGTESQDKESTAAIINENGMFVRNVTTKGYDKAIVNTSGHKQGHSGPVITEFTSHPVLAARPQEQKSLNLPIKETPYVKWEQDFDNWANVRTYGASADGRRGSDDTEAIQKAIDSGKTTLYLPKGHYKVAGTIEIRGKIERIVGCESSLFFRKQPIPLLKLVDNPGSPDVVVIEHLIVEPGNDSTAFDNASSRTVVLKHCKAFGGTSTGKGEIFYEDVVGGRLRQYYYQSGQKVWARHINTETRNDVTHLVNDGSQVWILGLKTENPGVLVETKNGGATEVLGHFAYGGMMQDTYNNFPMYLNNESSISISMGGAFFGTKTRPDIIVEDIQNGQSKKLKRTDVPKRSGLVMMPLYIGKKQ